MIVSTSNWAANIGPAVKKGFLLGFERIPEDRSVFYTVESSSKESELLLSYGDIGTMGAFSGSLDYDQVKQNYTKTVTAVEYARAIGAQKKLVLTDQVRAIEKLSKALGVAAKRRYLSDAYAWLVNAFNTSYTGGDTLALCSSAHTSNVGGSNQSNAGSSAFSPAAVDATRILMQRFNTNRDNAQFEITPDTLIVPLELEAYAEEVVKSKGKVDALNNNINFHYGKYRVIASRMLADTNNWFMVDSTKMKEYNMWFDVQKLELEKDVDFSTKVSRWSAYCYYGFGSERWEHIYGHNVA